MNLTIQNIEMLSRALLGAPPDNFNLCLSDYEQKNKPALDKLLDENHRYAKIMDSGSDKTFTLLEQKLTALNSDPDGLLQRLNTTAGYR